MTGMVTASWISLIFVGSAIRATPPSRRMSAGTRSSAMTATAPAFSAMRAWSASVTSMITPPLSISARPDLTLIVPVSAIAVILASEQARQTHHDRDLSPHRIGAGRLEVVDPPELPVHAKRDVLVGLQYEVVRAPAAVQR